MPRLSTRRISDRMHRMLAAAVIVGVLSTSACVAAPPRPPAPAAAVRLTLGTLLPGAANPGDVGPRTGAAIALAVADIAAARAGITVTTISADGSATDPQSAVAAAANAAAALLTGGVTAVIGAAASGLSTATIDRFSRAGVVQLSPIDGASELSTTPDAGLFWRTAPSDILRGRALGNRILADGALRVGILYSNDSVGTATHTGVAEALTAGGAAAVSEIFEPGAIDFAGPLDRILRITPDAIVVISGSELRGIATELQARTFDLKRLYGDDRNVGVLEGAAVDAVGARFSVAGAVTPPALEARLPPLIPTGSPSPTGAAVIDRSFAPEAYDATVLLALASLEARSNGGTVIASRLRDVSSGGTRCTSFAACARMIAVQTNIDYDGQSGRIPWTDRGDIADAQTRIFRFADGNIPVFSGLAQSAR